MKRVSSWSVALRVCMAGWALLASCPYILAQVSPVAVTATVTGANGAVYSGGTWQAQLIDASGNALQQGNLGASFTPLTQFSGKLSSTGALSVSLYSNPSFIPSGSQWNFRICSAPPSLIAPLVLTAQVCFTQAVTITTAGDISSTLSAGAPAVYAFNPVTGTIYSTGGNNPSNVVTSTTSAKLPSSPATNSLFWVTDSTSAAACGPSLGGGATLVLCTWNGSAWGTIYATQPAYDASAAPATDAYVQAALLRYSSVLSLNVGAVGGGTLSFNSQGSGVRLLVTVSGGTITGVSSVVTAGSGYVVGDLITLANGNYDNVIAVTGVSSGGVTSAAVLYGGTGNGNGPFTAQAGFNSIALARIVTLSGALTSNTTFIAPGGTYLTTSAPFDVANNTTGSSTVTLCGAANPTTDSCSGGRTVVAPQGTSNSSLIHIVSDGEGNVDVVGGAIPAVTGSIGGSLLSVGCNNQSTVTVPSATTAMTCVMSGVSGNPTNIQPQCSVTSANTVTPQLCTAVAVTPTAQVYNIRVVR